jgi:hypothetical protein
MDKSPLIVFTIFAAIITSLNAHAFDGNELKSMCDLSAPACTAYILGARDGVVFAWGVGGTPWCFPDGVTNEQTMLVVQKYLRDYPEELHKFAVILTVDALVDAFPCGK